MTKATIRSDDIETIESAGMALIRSGDAELAWPLLALALRIREEIGLHVPSDFSKRVPSNVIPLERRTTV